MARVKQSVSRFSRQLTSFAELCVARGLNLQRGQELIVTAPLEAAPLVQRIARFSYARGATLVTCLYEDPQLIRDHLAESGKLSLDFAPDWMFRGVAEGMRSGAARLLIAGPYPDLLSGISMDRIARAHRARAQSMKEEESLLAQSRVNWCMLPYVTASWAKQVFPELPVKVAQEQLWNVVFDAAHLAGSASLQSWDAHLNKLNAVREALQRRSFKSLRFFDGKTDLTVDLAQNHPWEGGTSLAGNGVYGVHNIPAEEVFTALGGNGARGQVFFSRPLALGGTVVENLYAEFDCGILTRLRADRGVEAFEGLIGDDEGSRKLGEVGLVPGSSRLARAGISYWNPLLDRNAVSHLAFGKNSAADSHNTDREEANEGTIRIDCMLGHTSMHVDGIAPGGEASPVMRFGEFVEFA
jgi:aminopeptidase